MKRILSGVLFIVSMGSVAWASADPAAARLLTASGQVEAALETAPGDWRPAVVDQTLGTGDRLRTGERSRAAVRLSNASVLRINELTTLTIRPDPDGAATSALDLRAGAAYFFHRERETTRFSTPTASGAIRGTEFHLAVGPDGGTVLTLLEGEVEIGNEFGVVVLTGGEQATVEPGEAPRRTAVIDAVQIIQWTLYYPAVLDPDELDLEEEVVEALEASLAAYREGDLLAALERYPADRQPATDAERVYRAAVLLAAGQVEAAERGLAEIDGLEGREGRLADALREMVAAVKQRPWERETPREWATEWMAGSYFAQSQGRLEEAREMAWRAVEVSPRFGFAWARAAEMEFSFGRSRAAGTALGNGIERAPRNAQAVALQGFILSAENRHGAAYARFEEAIVLDGALGNAWLGRGLLRIRDRRVGEGLHDLQTAAALEPQRSLLRSYLGKAYEHAREPDRAEHEWALAMELDPADPTPWLYSAIFNHRHHRVNRAIRELETSQELNDNRRIFRSRLLLDQDRAVRGANLAAIYRDAGMTDYSVREASRAVHHDYTNYSAHLFLANSYDALRDRRYANLRYETPWASEWLLASLLAPVGAGTLSQNVSQQEYTRMFEGNRLGLMAETEYRSGGDWLHRISQFGVVGDSEYAVDGRHDSQNGDRPNQDLEDLALSAQFKHQLTPRDSIYLQGMYRKFRGGDLNQYYDPAEANPTFRFEEVQEPNLFAGYHRAWHPGSHTLVLAGLLNHSFTLTDGQLDAFTVVRNQDGSINRVELHQTAHQFKSDFTGYSLEAQQILRQADHTFIVGGRLQTGTIESESFSPRPASPSHATFFGQGPPVTTYQAEADLRRVSAYGYHFWQIAEPVQLIAGASYDRVRYPLNTDLTPLSDGDHTRERWHPKAGVVWTPFDGTAVRGAYTRSIGGLFYDGSVRLEPAQVAGFTQAFRSMIPESVAGVVAGTDFTTYGIGLDQRLAINTYFVVEAELWESEGERRFGTFDFTFPPPAAPSSTAQRLDFRERSLAVAVNQLIGEQLAAGARYRLSRAELETRILDIPAEQWPTPTGETESTLHQVDLFLLWQHPGGFFTQGEALWWRQGNRGYDPERPGDAFWQGNVYAGYRFPGRHAEVRAGVLNVGDTDYRLNPLNLHAELPRERTLLLSLKVNF